MTVEQDAIDAAYKSVRHAKENGRYIDLDARQNIATVRENTVMVKATETIIEGFGGLIEGHGLD